MRGHENSGAGLSGSGLHALIQILDVRILLFRIYRTPLVS